MNKARILFPLLTNSILLLFFISNSYIFLKKTLSFSSFLETILFCPLWGSQSSFRGFIYIVIPYHHIHSMQLLFHNCTKSSIEKEFKELLLLFHTSFSFSTMDCNSSILIFSIYLSEFMVL